MYKKFYFLIFTLVIIGIAVVSSGVTPQASETSTQLQVAFLDVGQGDAILITTPHRHHILIDGGPDSTILTRLGEQMHFNEHSFDLVVTTHNHSDHIAGLSKVLERYDAQKIWISGAIHTTNEYLNLLQTIKKRGFSSEVAWKGKTFDDDGLHLEVLFPLTDQQGMRPEDQHDATIVTKAIFGNKSFLLTGDINEGHEQAIIQSGANLKADVLKVPHHGSSSGLALNFLNLVNPQFAVIQVGEGNRYGHPGKSILEKLSQKNIPIFRNDINGTIVFSTDGNDLAVIKRD